MGLFHKDDKSNFSGAQDSSDSELGMQLKKIREHLVFLEKKIDQLLGQSTERKPFQRDFSRPRRPFRPHDRPGGGHHPHHSGDERSRDRQPSHHGHGGGHRPHGDHRPERRPFFKGDRP